MSPRYHTLVYGEPKKALVSLLEGGGWGGAPPTLTLNNTVELYGEDKMDWRGECFLMTGTREDEFLFPGLVRGGG